jgi:hypothetical protein
MVVPEVVDGDLENRLLSGFPMTLMSSWFGDSQCFVALEFVCTTNFLRVIMVVWWCNNSFRKYYSFPALKLRIFDAI